MVGALVQVFEKSARELKLKQKLLKCKSTIQIATFNVWTLNRIGQLPGLTVSAIDHHIDIIYVQEHWYFHSKDMKYYDTSHGWTTVNAVVGGVSILIGPRALKSQNSIEKIQQRMMVATFNGNSTTTIISCYSPTNVCEEAELIAFHNELSSLVRSIPKHNVLIIGGAMNVQTDKKRKQQIQLTQLVKQKWGTSNRFYARK